MDHITEYVLIAVSIIVAATGIMAAYAKYANFDEFHSGSPFP